MTIAYSEVKKILDEIERAARTEGESPRAARRAAWTFFLLLKNKNRITVNHKK